ncbi:hypothetical protein GCM10007416_34880 [Kroppenstedtia guangzhouensis]|uniref:Uncharacterized protein n=1 Tax=Kroppenstedtia guangzhouensis TaxID=1274356 RepID=A0ABQ1H5R1_9BACL|nr:hypothetical protein [Kroppenstedtia guangzhouensis]GGA58727.1 hypothetical protein GCM10007416_34880 [Kroppenstedtia guangzhouensis]
MIGGYEVLDRYFFDQGWRLIDLKGYGGLMVWDPRNDYFALVHRELLEEMERLIPVASSLKELIALANGKRAN